MPKTRNALALRDFDDERILQRPYFRKFREEYQIGDDADEGILETLGAAEADSFETTQKKFDTLDALLVKTTEYQRHIKRHGERLTAYERKVANRIASDEKADVGELRERFKRANELSMKYCGCVTDASSATTFFLGGIAVDNVGGLIQKMVTRYKELDDKIKTRYRKIFATRLKQAREAAGLTQSELSKRTGLKSRAISNYEQALNEPSLATLVRFSQRLKRPVGYFLGTD